jgi:glycosyltransferase involved in cell wall biosynthesis
MHLLIITEVLPEAYHWNPVSPQRGTEKFYVRTAEAAVALNHTVTVVYDGPTKICHGVLYHPRGEITRADQYGRVLVCNPRGDFEGYTMPTANRVTVWTNFHFDTPRQYQHWLATCPAHNDLVVISPYAEKLMPVGLKTRIVPHGIDHDLYLDEALRPTKKRQVAFTSSPDRGLKLLEDLWDEYQIEAELGYKLVSTSYGQRSMTNSEVRGILEDSEFWVHPGIGNELFCLSAAEAQAAGCTPIIVPTGALSTTVLHGYRFTAPSFAVGLVSILSGEATIPGINAAHIPSWEAATECLLDPYRGSLHI